MSHGKNNQGIKEHQQEIVLAKGEVLYMLKDRLLVRDKYLTFLSHSEVKQLVTVIIHSILTNGYKYDNYVSNKESKQQPGEP
eukprot:589769-Ditylum_brightwellii.AAC.1